MIEEVQINAFYHFPGITVIVPAQDDKSRLVVQNLMERIPKEIFEPQEGFELIRVIANIVLFRSDNLEESVKVFKPCIEFRIGYTFTDVMESNCKLEGLKLAYWDGTKWVIISDLSYGYKILPPSTAQVAEVKICSWIGDPVLAWGR